MGNHRLAQEQFQRSLQIAHEMRFTPLILSILVGIARLLIETGRVQQGLEILFFVQDQNEVEHETCVRAQLLLELARQKLPTDQLAVAQKRGRQKNLHTELNSVQSLIILEIPLNNDSLKRDHVLQAANQSWIEPLTPREMEVLEPMSEGLTNRQIAERLIVSVGTVKSYTSQIYGKLGVANRTQAVAQARTLNILSR
jgi:ATP/maltotriose-dependent transcriptional regulator MalT